jgi:hypothetical protein
VRKGGKIRNGKMNKNRKIKRQRVFANEKTANKLSVSDFILMLSISMMLVGGIIAFLQYAYFSGGVPEGISNSQFGTEYISEKPPGDPGRKANAVMGVSCFGIGALLTSVTLMYKTITKKLQKPDDNYSFPVSS